MDRNTNCKDSFTKRPSNELRFVIIGNTGSGKSATGNTILNQTLFESMVLRDSVTNQSKYGHGFRMGRKLVVIDTPGLFDTGMSNEVVTKEIVKCITMSAPGPHAFLLTINIGRFTKEEQDTVRHFVNHFGEELYKYLIIVFTRADDLERDNVNINDFIDRSPQALKEIIDRCGGRYIPLNNKDSESAKERQVRTLVALVDDIANQNVNQFYTYEMFAEAEQTLKEKEEQLKQECDNEKCIKIDTVRQEYEGKIRNEDEIEQEYKIKMQYEIERLKAKYIEKYDRNTHASGDFLRSSERKQMYEDEYKPTTKESTSYCSFGVQRKENNIEYKKTLEHQERRTQKSCVIL